MHPYNVVCFQPQSMLTTDVLAWRATGGNLSLFPAYFPGDLPNSAVISDSRRSNAKSTDRHVQQYIHGKVHHLQSDFPYKTNSRNVLPHREKPISRQEQRGNRIIVSFCNSPRLALVYTRSLARGFLLLGPFHSRGKRAQASAGLGTADLCVEPPQVS